MAALEGGATRDAAAALAVPAAPPGTWPDAAPPARRTPGTSAPASPPAPIASRRGALRAVLEILDREGQVRQSFDVHHWPLHVGRGLDNDIVLADPHLAARHFAIDIGIDGDGDGEAGYGAGLRLRAGDTRNGVLLGAITRLRAGEQAPLAALGEAIEISAGRTRMRLRLPGHALAAELPLAPGTTMARHALPSAAAALLLLAGVLFEVYLITDPDGQTRAAGLALLSALAGAAVWCGGWALLSKTFTRQARFGWHLRVFLFAGVALAVLGALPDLIAFTLSWPWVADFAFVAEVGVGATALYFHLLAVEPARHRALRWVAVGAAVAGVALMMGVNVQRTDRPGDELYMSHLFPPALRLARPVAATAFIDGLAPLKATLDRKAKEPARGDDAAGRVEID